MNRDENGRASDPRSSTRRPTIDRPAARAAGRRALLFSATAHVVGVFSALGLVVLDGAPARRPEAVRPRCVTLPDSSPLRDDPPVHARVELPPRVEYAASTEDSETQDPFQFPLASTSIGVLLDDPLRAGGLGERIPRRRGRPRAGASPAENGPAAEAGGAAGGSGSAPLPRRVPVRTPAIALQEEVDERDYPRLARRRGWEGVVEIELEIDMRGAVKSVRVINADRPIFGAAAKKIAARWTYLPATEGGVPTETTIRRSIAFELADP